MTPWEVIEEALQRRKPPRDQAWLAEQLGVGPQAITNWKNRGVPARQFRALSTLFGLTVDQIEGLEPLPWASNFAWPFSSQLQERVERMDSEALVSLEAAIWEKLGEPPPAVVQEQLRKALDSLDRSSFHMEEVTSASKAKHR